MVFLLKLEADITPVILYIFRGDPANLIHERSTPAITQARAIQAGYGIDRIVQQLCVEALQDRFILGISHGVVIIDLSLGSLLQQGDTSIHRSTDAVLIHLGTQSVHPFHDLCLYRLSFFGSPGCKQLIPQIVGVVLLDLIPVGFINLLLSLEHVLELVKTFIDPLLGNTHQGRTAPQIGGIDITPGDRLSH